MTGLSDEERERIERWADDHFTQGEVRVVMQLVDAGWRPPDAQAARDAAGDERVRALREVAESAIAAIGTGGHGHWRSGGAGGVCSACDHAREVREEHEARLRAALAEPADEENPR